MYSEGKFGEKRLILPEYEGPKRNLFNLMGIVDPTHYLHSRYFISAVNSLENFSPERILDVGCGGGDFSFYMARRFPDAKVLGVDIDEEQIEKNKETADLLEIGNAAFLKNDILNISADNLYDFVSSIDVLEYIEKQDQALAKITKALKPEGYAFFHIPTIPPKPVPFSKRLENSHQSAKEKYLANELSAEQFAAKVQEAGLEVIKLTKTFGYWTGQLANSLFVLPHTKENLNQSLQAFLSPYCRGLCLMDSLGLDQARYAVAILAKKTKQP